MNIKETIGKKIAMFRKQRKMSQLDLSKAVGLSRSSMANVEAGRQRCNIETYYKLAHMLEVDLIHIFPSVDEVYREAKLLAPKEIFNMLKGEKGKKILKRIEVALNDYYDF